MVEMDRNRCIGGSGGFAIHTRQNQSKHNRAANRLCKSIQCTGRCKEYLGCVLLQLPQQQYKLSLVQQGAAGWLVFGKSYQ
jgi:hypothetical protein